MYGEYTIINHPDEKSARGTLKKKQVFKNLNITNLVLFLKILNGRSVPCIFKNLKTATSVMYYHHCNKSLAHPVGILLKNNIYICISPTTLVIQRCR